jgi:hypothetical protein
LSRIKKGSSILLCCLVRRSIDGLPEELNRQEARNNHKRLWNFCLLFIFFFYSKDRTKMEGPGDLRAKGNDVIVRIGNANTFADDLICLGDQPVDAVGACSPIVPYWNLLYQLFLPIERKLLDG